MLLKSLLCIVILYQVADACRRHEDCAAPNSLCFSRHCIIAEPVPPFSCRSTLQCRRPGQPWKNQAIGCKAGSPGTGRCDSQRDCRDQSVCIRKHCVPAEPTDTMCTTRSDCPRNTQCLNGMCFRPLSGGAGSSFYPESVASEMYEDLFADNYVDDYDQPMDYYQPSYEDMYPYPSPHQPPPPFMFDEYRPCVGPPCPPSCCPGSCDMECCCPYYDEPPY